MVTLLAIRDRLRLSLWFLPALFAVAALVLALVLVAVDETLSNDPGSLFFVFGGTAEGARSVLSTIAQSMLTFTGLVFSITMLVLQLASSQLSPRVMRTFLRDRGNQVVLGLFVATFVYTLVVLREVRTPVDGDDGFVPGLSVWVAFALLLGSVAAFIYYIDHMAHAIRASTVVANIWRETVEAVERLYPERVGGDAREALGGGPVRAEADLVLKSTEAGVVVAVDEDRLLGVAREDGRIVEVVPSVGDFVPEGMHVARLWGRWDRDAADQVRAAIGVGSERTLDQDAAFGIRQLVDVAIRALSPGTNDPTTAIQALDRIHDLLRRLVGRQFPSETRVTDGRVALILHRPDWSDYVRLGLDEIRLAGAGQIQVHRRMRALLEDLATVAPPDRLPPIREELAMLDAGVPRAFADRLDREVASLPSARGHAATSEPPQVPR